MNYKFLLPSWIIQDGNYEEFKVGDIVTFPLEMILGFEAEISPNPEGERILTHTTDNFYTVTRALVVYQDTIMKKAKLVNHTKGVKQKEKSITRASRVTVVDLGPFKTFTDRYPPPSGYKVGDVINSQIHLEVDPYFYKEDYFKRPKIPKLDYQWKIELIEMLIAPWVQHPKHNGCIALVRTWENHSWKSIEQTNVWEDDDAMAEYLITCSLV